jgi:hypothetical protein
MSNEYQQILRLLPAVTPEERKKLKVLVGAFKGGKSVQNSSQERYPNGNVNANGDWLFEGIIAELGRRGLNYRAPQVTQSRSENYEQDSVFVRTRLEQNLKVLVPQPKRAHFLALGSRSAHSLAEYISRWDTPLGLKFMLNNVSRTFEALDRSFPGYLASGMVGVLVQRDIQR